MNDRKIIVDVVCPKGGFRGGVEDVIRSWTKNLNRDVFDLRIMHMTPGTAYLDGYEKAYYLKEERDYVDPSYCATGYNFFIEQLGAPDICIACNNPVMSQVCDTVRKYRNLNMKIFSWVHNEIGIYEEMGNGGVREMLYADYHLAICGSIERDIKAVDGSAIVYNIGNPILHELPKGDMNDDGRTLCFVGRLDMVKRLDVILEAMYKAKSRWNLTIVGDGDLKDEIKKWIKLMKLKDRVKMVGWKENPLPYIKNATALISASEYEGFMITGAEALAMGKPVISTPTQGVSDYVKEGENGFFYGFTDSDALALLLDEIASKTKKLPSPEVCKKSVERFMPENYFSSLEKIFTDAYATL